MPEAAGLYWEEQGAGNGGVPLILSAGLGGSGSYWRDTIPALARERHVIAYDHRGTGRSSPDVPGVLTVQAMADDVVALMDALGIARATLIGHAAGGLIGLAMALAAPGRLDRLVVVNGWAKLDPHTARCFDVRQAILRDSGPRAYLHAQPLFLYPPQWISDNGDRLAAEEEVLLGHFPGAEMMGRRIAALRRFDIADRLGEIATRTLFVATDDDMLVPPSCSGVLADGVPGAQLARLTHGGHACNIARPDHFDQWLLAWLGSDEE